jgi:hypothetical protein
MESINFIEKKKKEQWMVSEFSLETLLQWDNNVMTIFSPC